MRYKILVLLLLVSWLEMAANPHTRVRVGMLGGGVMQTGYTSEFKLDRPVLGAEVAVEFMSTYEHPWSQHFNNSSWGVGATYFNYGNNAKLGSCVAFYPYVDFHLVYLPHFILSLRPGVGIAFNDKRYANTISDERRWESLYNGPGEKEAPANQAIGSVVNAYLQGVVVAEFPIKDGWSVEASAGWNHMSNGSIKTPNGGMNLFTGQVAAKYFPQGYSYRQPVKRSNKMTWREKQWSMEAIGSAGVRELYYKDRKAYATASVSVAGYYQPWHIFRIGLGADAFYDGVYSAVNVGRAEDIRTLYRKTYTTKENRVKNCFRVGVSLQPELVLGRLMAGFSAGIYLWDPHKNWEPYTEVAKNGGQPVKRGIFYKYRDTSNKQDGWFYTKAQVKYLITDHLLVALALKTHLQKAECIELGIGYHL